MPTLHQETVTLAAGMRERKFTLSNRARLLGMIDTSDDLVLSATGHSMVWLGGKAKRVIINRLDASSLIDLTEVTTTEVIVQGVEGGSFLHLAANGVVRVDGPISGGSQVFVPKAHAFAVMGAIEGQSKLHLQCRTVALRSKIDGQSRLYLASHHGVIVGPELAGSSFVVLLEQPPLYGATATFQHVEQGSAILSTRKPERLTGSAQIAS